MYKPGQLVFMHRNALFEDNRVAPVNFKSDDDNEKIAMIFLKYHIIGNIHNLAVEFIEKTFDIKDLFNELSLVDIAQFINFDQRDLISETIKRQAEIYLNSWPAQELIALGVPQDVINKIHAGQTMKIYAE